MYSNINLSDNSHQYQYVIEYTGLEGDRDGYVYYVDGKRVFFNRMGNDGQLMCPYKSVLTHYEIESYDVNKMKSYYTPRIQGVQKIPMTTVNFYFPRHSIEHFYQKIKYAINFKIWIGDYEVNLGTFIFDRIDALASEGIKTFNNERYFEVIKFPIIDPFRLIYGDEWQAFRSRICQEKQINGHALNNIGSLLYCSLHPVYELDGNYISADNITGGQNSIQFAQDNEMTILLSTNVQNTLEDNDEPSFNIDLKFNPVYEDLRDYLYETYGIEFDSKDPNHGLKVELIIGDEENLYCALNKFFPNVNTTHFSFTKTDLISSRNFSNWNGYKEGMFIKASIDFVNNTKIVHNKLVDYDSLLYLLSNQLPFTPNLYKYFTKSSSIYGDDGKMICNIRLDDMQQQVFNVVNKTVQEMTIPAMISDTKNHIIQPVFYKAQESRDIIVHPAVNENICINLDDYKNNVERFILQVENRTFAEYGRIPQGIVFKILGKSLPCEIQSGVYYILDQNNELVTTGKYKYEM